MTVAKRSRRRTPVPVYSYGTEPGVPPVSVLRIDEEALARVDGQAHAHDFPGLVYFERPGGLVRFLDRTWTIGAGDVLLIAPGAVVDIGEPAGLLRAGAWGVFFSADALGAWRAGWGAPASQLAWRSHPLLRVFVGQGTHAVLRLTVPAHERPTWLAQIAAIDREVTSRLPGYREAALAHLVILLTGAGRLASEADSDLRVQDDELLSQVFAVIERRFREPLSLKDVADEVHLSPGHLTTTVRLKTGRTVQDWIVERRMTEARRLLASTDVAVAEVARRVGYPDAAYFGRVFRRAHNATPRTWRASRSL